MNETRIEFKDPQVIAWINSQKGKDLSALIEAKIKQTLPSTEETAFTFKWGNPISIDSLFREYYPKEVLDILEKDAYVLKLKKGDVLIWMAPGKGSHRDIDKFTSLMNSHGIRYGLFISPGSISRQSRFSWKSGDYGEFMVFISECTSGVEIINGITFIDIVIDYKGEKVNIGQQIWETDFVKIYNKIGEIRTLRRQFADTKEKVIRTIGNYAQGMITNVNEILSILYENIASLEIEIKSELKAIESKKKIDNII